MTEKKQFSHAATIIPVNNMAASIAYYRDALGFNLEFSWPEEGATTYAVLNREDAVSIHLSLREKGKASSGPKAGVYIFVYEVDALYEAYRATSANIINALADRDYGMRDFDVRDPDGFLLTFGTGIERLASNPK